MKLRKCIKSAFALMLCTLLLFSSVGTLAVEYVMTDDVIQVSEPPTEGNAYIIFTKTPQENMLSYVRGPEDRNHALYSEDAVFNHIECRQVFVQNKFHLKLDPSFASPEDSEFFITMEYWDYGGAGSYYVQYTNDKGGITEVQVPKCGSGGPEFGGKWRRKTLYIGDAKFTQSIGNGADIIIRSGAYNAYAKIEIENLKHKKDSTEHLGEFNKSQAKVLNALGLYKGVETEDGSFNPALDREIDLETALSEMVKILGFEKAALKEAGIPTIANVSDDKKALVAYAEKHGFVNASKYNDGKMAITQRDLLSFFIMERGGSVVEGNEEAIATEIGILKSENFVFQMNKRANYDNLIGLSKNALNVNHLQTGENQIKVMMAAEIITGDQLAASGDKDYIDMVLKGESKLYPETRIDPISGRTYYELGLFGQDAWKGYYTAEVWAGDSERFFFSDPNGYLYEYNIKTNMLKYLDELNKYENSQQYRYNVATEANTLFYIRPNWEIWAMDLATYEKRKIADPPECDPTWLPIMNMSMLECTRDGKKISIGWRGAPVGVDVSNRYKMGSYFPTLNTETGEWDTSYYWIFDWEQISPNHNSISPTNPDLMFFAHEGTGPAVPGVTNGYRGGAWDRVWCTNFATGQTLNSFEQKFFETNQYTGGPLCHEGWMYDGERIFAVKNGISWNAVNHTIGYEGCVYVDWDGKNRYYANGDYSYNHIGASKTSDRWFICDTHFTADKFNHLLLVDAWTGESMYLAQVDTTGQNPGHTHPAFSPNDQYAIFGSWDQNLKNVRICWMDVTDLTIDNARETYRADISESCEITTAKGLDHEVIAHEDENGKYYEIPVGNHMKVNAKTEVVYEETADVKVTVTYLDEGYLPIEINYNTWHVLQVHNRLTSYSKYIERNNTKKWKTASFILEDASMDNMEWLGTDFKVMGVKTNAKIKSIEIEKI